MLDAAFDTVLSRPGRLRDPFVSYEAMTPGEWKAGGAGLEVRYGWHDSPFGDCLIAATERGVCGLAFDGAGDRVETLAYLATSFDVAGLVEDDVATRAHAEAAFGGGYMHLVLRGTPFQLKVWEALLRIPQGKVVTYSDLARRIGRPSAARAVAGAVGRNPVSWVVPCHRVIGDSGFISGYRWGPRTKRVILAWEAAQDEACRTAS